MEPVGLALGVVSVFKDAYLTAKFIRNTIQSIKGYEAEQSQLLMRYNVQIYRLKNFSRLFRDADSNVVDMKLLETEYLNMVKDLLLQLKNVLAEYAQHAAFLDDDYQRFSPSSPQFKFDPAKDYLEIEDSHMEDVAIEPISNPDNKSGKQTRAKSLWWLFGGFRGGRTRRTAPSKKLISLQSLPPGMQWVFKRSKLEETLQAFEMWNEKLESVYISRFLVGFGFYDENRKLQGRLRADGDQAVHVNIFQAHVKLNELANDDPNFKEPSGEVSCREAEDRIFEGRILVEYKTISKQPEIGNGRNIIQPMKELYGPQLARLLRTAGEHSFHTLPFNSYAWNAEKTQYMFLFNYPSDTSGRTPKSLHDFMMSSELKYKLELRQRFFVAQTMAHAIGTFHSDGWLHKSIRSHAVKFFFFPDGHKCDFENPYLTDFEFSRPLGVTRLAPQAIEVDYDVYRHPDRHGLPGISFSKMHDIYSLGVVLLEIGLWQTAKQIHDDVIKYEREEDTTTGCLEPQEIKEAFLQDATERLAQRMGRSYQEAVIACLDGDWDELVEPRDFAKEFYKRVVQKVDIKAFAS
ncbi:hypothetical protein CGCF415_v007144 [Colletotrichum fructicola]|uniref:Serine threonine protein kinase n=1 Tax=Colletotrichum fructicola (strain Nara gc5) TaxID=1213859 RepID=L2FGD4_COLFN|nr:hypothetical protein CFRS1_v010682 [Colletotrichum fructicola]KAF4479796.1 hypothetical protein CGGC5_v011926 [Colletotrichum fructicola Nara gc5]KAF4898577.1 hypothetical protein CGCFRS4_v004412 [Colletotrichum fructicola]KAF4907736.1 hypothetical protein CGCF415_v007144 [Colletotrichum fructicola]KAF5490820.1 hypothetical protein CGCF413_v010894 [Colletotrichum fructicola]